MNELLFKNSRTTASTTNLGWIISISNWARYLIVNDEECYSWIGFSHERVSISQMVLDEDSIVRGLGISQMVLDEDSIVRGLGIKSYLFSNWA